MTRTQDRLNVRTTTGVAFAGLLAAFALGTGTPILAYADTSAEIQQQLDDANAKLDSLQDNIDTISAELGQTSSDLDDTNSQIDSLQSQITDNEQKLDQARSDLAEVMRSSYKQDSYNSLISLVFGSGDFNALISNLHYANKVSERQQAAIQEVNDLQDSLNSQKSDLEQKKEVQEQLAQEQKDQLAQAQAAADEQSSYVNSLSDDLKAAIQEEEERKAAELAAQAAAQAKAEQEAAAAAAAAANENSKAQDNASSGTTDNGGSSSSTGSSSSSSASPASPSASTGGSTASTGSRQTAVNAALSLVGKPYSHANTLSSGFDCNGLTNYAWACAGVSIPYPSGAHTSWGQFQWMKASGRWVTSASALQPGDLVFFSYNGGATTYHVGLYIGGGMTVQALSPSQGIQKVPLNFCHGFCGGGSPI